MSTHDMKFDGFYFWLTINANACMRQISFRYMQLKTSMQLFYVTLGLRFSFYHFPSPHVVRAPHSNLII